MGSADEASRDVSYAVFDIDRIDDYDDQEPQSDADPRLIPEGDPSASMTSEDDSASVSGTVLNVLIREMCRDGLLRLRHEECRGGYNFYLLDGTDPLLRPIAVLVASWAAWEELLDLSLGHSSTSTQLKPQESWGFRNATELLNQIGRRADSLADTKLRDEAHVLVAALRDLHARSSEADWTSMGAGAFAEFNAAHDSVRGRWEALDEPALGDVEEVLEATWLAETDVYEFHIPEWDDAMTWERLTAAQHLAVAAEVVNECFDPTSLLAALLMNRHPATTPEVKALIALSDISRLLENNRSRWT